VFKVGGFTYIYWPIECTPKPSFVRVFKVGRITTSIGQLNAFKNFDLNHFSSLQELLTSIGQLNALKNLDLNNC
jgi:hypothetical protein